MRQLIRILGGISIGVLAVALFIYAVLSSLGCIDVCSADAPRVIGAIFVGPALLFTAIPWILSLVQAARLSERGPLLVALLLLASDGGELFPSNAPY
jgi:hypothetical protein